MAHKTRRYLLMLVTSLATVSALIYCRSIRLESVWHFLGLWLAHYVVLFLILGVTLGVSMKARPIFFGQREGEEIAPEQLIFVCCVLFLVLVAFVVLGEFLRREGAFDFDSYYRDFP